MFKKLIESIRGLFGTAEAPAPTPTRPRGDKKERDGQRPSRSRSGDRQRRDGEGSQGGQRRRRRPSRGGKPDGSRRPQEEKGQREQGSDASNQSGQERRQGGRRRQRRKPETPQGQGESRPQIQKHVKKELGDWDVSQFVVPEDPEKKRFHDFDLPPEVMKAIADLNFQYCTPIQAEIMGDTLAGKDATGKAQTGTGKTAAFLITIFNHLLRNPRPAEEHKPGVPRALILAPTRELVIQIAKDAYGLGPYTDINVQQVYGGTDYRKQKERIEGLPADIVVATPGRLLDFQQNKVLDLSKVEILVIDEADRMLDMGFIPDVKRIVYSTPPKQKRQTLFFSATLSGDVLNLANSWTTDAIQVEIEPEQVAVDTVEQLVYVVTNDDKDALLVNLVKSQTMDRVILFSNRREDSRKLADLLHKHGVECAILSGDVPQRRRIRTLEEFKEGKFQVLVATDVAGRGIHIEGLEHVINYTLPLDPEDYVHRIGRTGRAGSAGTSISFADEEDSYQIPVIEEFIGNKLNCMTPEEGLLAMPEPVAQGRHPQNLSRRVDGNGGGRDGGRGGRGGNRGRSGGGGRGRSGGGGRGPRSGKPSGGGN